MPRLLGTKREYSLYFTLINMFIFYFLWVPASDIVGIIIIWVECGFHKCDAFDIVGIDIIGISRGMATEKRVSGIVDIVNGASDIIDIIITM